MSKKKKKINYIVLVKHKGYTTFRTNTGATGSEPKSVKATKRILKKLYPGAKFETILAGKCGKRKKALSGKKRRPGRKPIRKHKKKIASKTHFHKLKGGVKKMAKRKRHSKRRYGFEGFEGRRKQIVVMGKKHRRGRRRGYLMGGAGGDLVRKVGNNALNVAAGIAGGIGGAYVSNMIPAPSNIKAIVPIAGGLLLASVANIPALKFAGLGIAIIGGLSLVKQIMPGVPVLAGETTIYIPGAGSQGFGPQLEDRSAMGDITDIDRPGDAAPLGWATQDSIG